MLTTLIIKDFAIIDRLEVAFEHGMTVLSGETGAGKSIVINALHLLLGGRASTDVIRGSASEAVVEGAFCLDHAPPSTRSRLDELGIDHSDDVLVVRRVVSRSGRNKVIVNGSLATVSTLRALTRGLIDISGQHEHYSLLDTSGHVDLVDRFGELDGDASAYRERWSHQRQLARELEALRERARDRFARIDYLRYQLQELAELELAAGEIDALTDERERLANVESIREATHGSVHALHEDEGSAVERIDGAVKSIERSAGSMSGVDALLEQLAQARALIDDAVYQLRDLGELDADPARLDEIETRLAELERVARKYGCDPDDLIAERDAMSAELANLDSAESRIDELQQEFDALSGELLDRARALSAARRSFAAELEGRIERELSTLGMASCVFEVSIASDDDVSALTASGIDRVEFLIAPNPGEDTRPLARIASGGELSRIMLALKQVFSENDDVSTYVFDEVDTGIGGAVAEQVARAVRRVSASHQVICITHLATIASYADRHFAVSKHVVEDRTVSEVRRLDDDERVREIARMIGGLSITERSLEHAAEMVARARIPGE